MGRVGHFKEVWSGHSCPLAVDVDLNLGIGIEIKPNFKGGGQECPPHTGSGG
jgi:hypothetical protein